MKRYIQAPQLVLGLAFSFGIPMVYVALGHAFDWAFCLLILANICWVMVFDTVYAMSDREDDLKIGVKSTAIWFGKYDKLIVGVLQFMVILILLGLGAVVNLSASFYFATLVASTLFVWQQWLIRARDRQACFQAFLNNGWFGGIIWFGLVSAF